MTAAGCGCELTVTGQERKFALDAWPWVRMRGNNTRGNPMKLAAALYTAAFALGGCTALPNIKDVDTSKAQPD